MVLSTLVSQETTWIVVLVNLTLVYLRLPVQVATLLCAIAWTISSLLPTDSKVLKFFNLILLMVSCLWWIGDSSKPKTGIIAGVTVVLFWILVFLFCRDRHKGYKRDVFVDVAGWFVDVAAVPPQIGLVCFVLWFVWTLYSGAAQNINIGTRMNLKSFTKY